MTALYFSVPVFFFLLKSIEVNVSNHINLEFSVPTFLQKFGFQDYKNKTSNIKKDKPPLDIMVHNNNSC